MQNQRPKTAMEDGEWVLARRPLEKDLWRPSSWEEDGPRPLKVTFTEPAKHWTDAIPIGNGRLGAMVWGGVASETLQLNGKPPGAFVAFCVSDHWHWNLAADFHLGFACFGFLSIQVLYLKFEFACCGCIVYLMECNPDSVVNRVAFRFTIGVLQLIAFKTFSY